MSFQHAERVTAPSCSRFQTDLERALSRGCTQATAPNDSLDLDRQLFVEPFDEANHDG